MFVFIKTKLYRMDLSPVFCSCFWKILHKFIKLSREDVIAAVIKLGLMIQFSAYEINI